MEKPDFRDYPNSPEGLAAYDAALEKFERVQKGPMIGTGFADTVEDVVQSAGEQISKIPGVNIGLQYLGGAVRTIDQVMSQDQGPGGMIYRTYQRVRSAAETGFSDLAESAGVDPRIGAFAGGELVDTLATAGLGSVVKKTSAVVDTLPPGGMSPQLATVGGMPVPTQLTPQVTSGGYVMKAVTTTDQPTLEAVGVRTGQSIVTPEQGRRLIRRDTEIERLKGSIQQSNEQLDALLELQGDPDNLRIFLDDNPEVKQLMGMYEGRPDQIKKVANRLRERRIGAQESLSRQQSNVLPFDETDPNFFRSKEGLAAKKDEEIRRNITGYLEQHHLFPKGISAAFFGKMDDLISKGKADKDDLIVMAEYAVKQGKRTGDVRSNLINMQKDPHNELHTMLRASGAELGKTDYVRSLRDVKDVNELMRRWRDMLDADVAYNVDTAKVWEPLDDLIKEVRASK